MTIGSNDAWRYYCSAKRVAEMTFRENDVVLNISRTWLLLKLKIFIVDPGHKEFFWPV